MRLEQAIREALDEIHGLEREPPRPSAYKPPEYWDEIRKKERAGHGHATLDREMREQRVRELTKHYAPLAATFGFRTTEERSAAAKAVGRSPYRMRRKMHSNGDHWLGLKLERGEGVAVVGKYRRGDGRAVWKLDIECGECSSRHVVSSTSIYTSSGRCRRCANKLVAKKRAVL